MRDIVGKREFIEEIITLYFKELEHDLDISNCTPNQLVITYEDPDPDDSAGPIRFTTNKTP